MPNKSTVVYDESQELLLAKKNTDAVSWPQALLNLRECLGICRANHLPTQHFVWGNLRNQILAFIERKDANS